MTQYDFKRDPDLQSIIIAKKYENTEIAKMKNRKEIGDFFMYDILGLGFNNLLIFGVSFYLIYDTWIQPAFISGGIILKSLVTLLLIILCIVASIVNYIMVTDVL